MTEGDERLLQQAASGDTAALRTLLERYGGQVWSEIDRDIGAQWRSSLDADDVMQVTYLEAFLHVDQLTARDGPGFLAWLRRVARNNLRDAIKELQRKKRPDPARRMTVSAAAGDESYAALINALGVTSSTPSRHAAQAEMRRTVDGMLDQIPSDYAAAIRLYDLEGRPVNEVARQMGRSSGAVHMLRARAHDRLRELLGSETNFFTDAG